MKKKKFKMRKGKNLFVQLAVMLPLSAGQSFAGIFAVFGLYGLISAIRGAENSAADVGIIGGAVICIIGAVLAVGISILMVKFKGAEAMDVLWNPNFEYDFSNADLQVLKNVYQVAKRYYKLESVPTDIIGDEILLTDFYASEIQAINLTDMSEGDRNYILNQLSPYKQSGGEEYHITVATAIWAILSPIAFLLQWIAVCAAINQLFSRRIFSCYGELPFPEVCLRFYWLQLACHFLFNFVIISDIKVFDWMGSIDEKTRVKDGVK